MIQTVGAGWMSVDYQASMPVMLVVILLFVGSKMLRMDCRMIPTAWALGMDFAILATSRYSPVSTR